MAAAPGCPLCDAAGGELLLRLPRLRVIRADEPGFAAFYRVVWNDHVAELSDLAPADRQHLLDAVLAVEQVLRRHASPDKVNLASLGNVVPHLHWHVIARHAGDSRWPAPVWAPAARGDDPVLQARLLAARPPLETALVDAVRALDPATPA